MDKDDEIVDLTIFRKLNIALRYICQNKLDICFYVRVVRKFIRNSLKTHVLASERVLRYINGTIHYVIALSSRESENVVR